MQTILGSGGAIGTTLAEALTTYTKNIRLVSRNPQKVNETDTLFPADLTDRTQVFNAVKGSEVVYLTIGLDYKTSIWKNTWPPLMRNVLDACKEHKAKLVFFDNVYMYDRNHLHHMTEETPVKASSKKGEVRQKVVEMLMDEMKSGTLEAQVARAADFLGPKNSVLIEVVYKNFKKGEKANWFLDDAKIHNFTYTPDAGKAVALLGNTPDAYNQVWHLPTSSEKMTGKDWIELFAKTMHVQPRYRVMPKWMFDVVGLFIPVLREMKEMLYQYDRDYFFDSTKFTSKFNIEPTSPEIAVKELVTELN